MIEPGTQITFKADGHDEASSMYYARWRTPSGAILREGHWYVKEWKLRFRTVLISARWRLLRYQGSWEIVSEEVAGDKP